MLRVSQPQMHNVLKGARNLTPELGDRILRCFGVTIIDLLNVSDLRSRFVASEVDVSNARDGQRDIPSYLKVQRLPPGREVSREGPNKQSDARPLGSADTA
jgi:plasmid maintenance system antidote protein VapI